MRWCSLRAGLGSGAIKLLLALVVVLGVAVGVYGYRAERPLLALCGLVALPAGMVLGVAVFPGYFLRDGRRR